VFTPVLITVAVATQPLHHIILYIWVGTRRNFNLSDVFIVTKFTCKQQPLWTIALYYNRLYTPKVNDYDVITITIIIITRYRDFTSGPLQCDNRAGKMGQCVGLHRAETNCENIIIPRTRIYIT